MTVCLIEANMDENVLNELLECSVCLELLDSSSKVLPCQHTFCRRCLDEILVTKNQLRCPECRFLVEIKVEDLPSNILLIRILEGMKNAKTGFGSYNSASPKKLMSCTGSSSGHIALSSAVDGDVMTVIRKVDDNWAEGKLADRIGIFPLSFVQMNDAAKWLVNNNSRASVSVIKSNICKSDTSGSPLPNVQTDHSPTTPTSTGPRTAITTSSSFAILTNGLMSQSLHFRRGTNKRHSLTALPNHHRHFPSPSLHRHHRYSMDINSASFDESMLKNLWPTSSTCDTHERLSGCSIARTTTPVQPRVAVCSVSMCVNNSQITTPTITCSSTSKDTMKTPTGSIYVALYNYKVRKDDEIELRKGDCYTVVEKCQDGWFKGSCLQTGRFGVFPGNYVQQVQSASVVPAEKPVSNNTKPHNQIFSYDCNTHQPVALKTSLVKPLLREKFVYQWTCT